MFDRHIAIRSVEEALRRGTVIRDYPDEKPYPSRLILHKTSKQALHVVAADDKKEKVTYIITVYIPDPAVWNEDYTERRKQ
jgi:hypothetical protein